jgi:hypothetical protein
LLLRNLGPQFSVLWMVDSGSTTSHDRDTSLTYHPFSPSVPSTSGRMAGPVESASLTAGTAANAMARQRPRMIDISRLSGVLALQILPRIFTYSPVPVSCRCPRLSRVWVDPCKPATARYDVIRPGRRHRPQLRCQGHSGLLNSRKAVMRPHHSYVGQPDFGDPADLHDRVKRTDSTGEPSQRVQDLRSPYHQRISLSIDIRTAPAIGSADSPPASLMASSSSARRRPALSASGGREGNWVAGLGFTQRASGAGFPDSEVESCSAERGLPALANER